MSAQAAGWRKVTLGEIYDIGSSKRVLQKQWKDCGVPFYRAREIVKLARDGFVANDLFISEAHFAELERAKGVPQPGDLMVSAVGTLGACYAVKPGDRFYFKDASVLLFRPIAPVDPRFMQYAFLWNGLLDQVNSSEGATVGTFTISRAKATEFMLPQLGEQQRIVAVLDQAFAALDRARAYAEDNLQDSNLLFKEILHKTIYGRFRRDQASFSKCSLADALDVIRNGVNCDQKAGGRCKISRIESIATGSFNLDRVGFAELTDSQKERARLLPGDILFSHINSVPHVGKTAVFDVDDDVYHGINLLLLRPSKGILSSYMSWFLKAVHATKYWEGVCKKSVNQASVNQKDIGKVPFFFPSTAKQSHVVQTLDDVSIQVANARQSYIEKLSELAKLRQSLLQKAFSGELT